MILVDTSVWVDHLNKTDAQLAKLLVQRQVLMHSFVLGEIACGNLRSRPKVLQLLQDLPPAVAAENDEVMAFMERHTLFGKGIGFVDVHLLASVALSVGARLWTRDKRLLLAAQRLGCSFVTTATH
jgi:predicted nucleic acid-binding protein